MSNKVHSYDFEVGFADTDASSWVHFSKTLIFVERAEHDLLQKLGIYRFGKQGGWPRAKVEIDYKQPLQFGDAARVEIYLAKLGSASLKWAFTIFKGAEVLAAKGQMVTVRVNDLGRPAIIAEEDQEKLKPYLCS